MPRSRDSLGPLWGQPVCLRIFKPAIVIVPMRVAASQSPGPHPRLLARFEVDRELQRILSVSRHQPRAGLAAVWIYRRATLARATPPLAFLRGQGQTQCATSPSAR